MNKTFLLQGPGDITVSNTAQDHLGPHAPLQNAGDDIWHPSEAVEVGGTQEHDPREVPEYEIKFKQAVTAEDVFLGVRHTRHFHSKLVYQIKYIINR